MHFVCLLRQRLFLAAVVPFMVLATAHAADSEKPPHGQDKPPGPALSPEEAIKKMTVPEGFTVELVASEPMIVNPVAMTIDERGRFWITESLEYPRRQPGPGQDRVKVLEDTDHDGRMDKATVFADGLNIPSGIAVGHGGVWVANAPDILFYPVDNWDTLKHGTPQVVVTGFGRDDTHELPNSLTWGPDGWLYGLNGVFNRSRIKHNGKEFDFTCALFRIHPRTREFQLFAQGTSNPWGVAWDSEGAAFVSACVIDHLWHLAESGYYHRQGGPYPDFTWKLGSIVNHKHQKAAYCGIHFFDSDAYPEQYREKLYMGNIHGNCINVDKLARRGSTYHATGEPDFLSANDAWFMPVVQKTGPDGCLYVLDWYDRYHCYQDANRDPEGIDRLKGRLYRVRYKDTPRAEPFDLTKETDKQLIARLASPNVFYRDLAQRILSERRAQDTIVDLENVIANDTVPRKQRLHALWALIGAEQLTPGLQLKLLNHADPTFQAWAIRAAGNNGGAEGEVKTRILELAKGAHPDVLLQIAIAAPKLEGVDALALLVDVLAAAPDDPIIPVIIWQNAHALIAKDTPKFLALVKDRGIKLSPEFTKRMTERVLAARKK